MKHRVTPLNEGQRLMYVKVWTKISASYVPSSGCIRWKPRELQMLEMKINLIDFFSAAPCKHFPSFTWVSKAICRPSCSRVSCLPSMELAFPRVGGCLCVKRFKVMNYEITPTEVLWLFSFLRDVTVGRADFSNINSERADGALRQQPESRSGEEMVSDFIESWQRVASHVSSKLPLGVKPYNFKFPLVSFSLRRQNVDFDVSYPSLCYGWPEAPLFFLLLHQRESQFLWFKMRKFFSVSAVSTYVRK